MKYKDKLSGKEYTFTVKPGEMMIKTTQDSDSTDVIGKYESESKLSQIYQTDSSYDYGCYMLRSDDMDIETLNNEPGIENTFPVVTDNEGNERYFLPEEITVQFKEDVDENKLEKLIDKAGCSILKKQWTPGYYTLQFSSKYDLFKMIDTFNKMDEVVFAEPSSVGFNDDLYIPDDPNFRRQWHLHNTGQTGGRTDADIDAPEAWNIERGDSNVAIAIIDTGVDLDHEDLRRNILPRPALEDWDFADTDLVPEDEHYHGTHCAGIAASVDNASGTIGLAPNCSILPIRIDLRAGRNANRADAINFVTSIAPRYSHVVISCSWRASGDISGIHRAIINAYNHNIVICFAAGNDNNDMDVRPQYPGAYREVISVASTDHNDRKSSFSNFGSTIDVSAPGSDILATFPNNTYNAISGTSMSCPQVAALAGLIWSKNPDLTSQQVRDIIENNCDNIDAYNAHYTGKLGKGRINAYKALLNTPNQCRFTVKGKFKFPQHNAGSSSALTMLHSYFQPWKEAVIPKIPIKELAPVLQNKSDNLTLVAMPPFFKPRSYLCFLTQKAYSEKIYFLQPTTGRVVKSIDPVKNDTIGSMTFDGKYLKVANVTTGAGYINTINPYNGAQISSIKVPSGRGEAMTFDGKYLYYSTITRIYKIVPSTGVVVHSFPVPGGGQCRSLACDGRNHIFMGDTRSDEIVVFEKNTLRVICRFPAPGTGTHRVEGLAYDKYRKMLYIANQSDNIIYYGTLGM